MKISLMEKELYSPDNYGRLLQKESPSGFKLLHVYNADGYLTDLRDASNANANLWQANTINAFGQITVVAGRNRNLPHPGSSRPCVCTDH